MRPERLYLRDILEAADDILAFTEDVGFDEFVTDRMRRSAVLQRLSVIGEAASHLGAGLRRRYPEVGWRDMIGFRSVIVHGYFGLEWPIVWDTAVNDVPRLREQVLAILAAEFPDERVD